MRGLLVLAKTIFFLSVVLHIYSSFQKNILPPKSEIKEELFKEPVQKLTQTGSFDITRKGIKYTIVSKYSYELYGLVVSYFNADTWWNIYHEKWKDNINKKDICVIWGDNIRTEAYRKMKFSSTSFEAHYSTRDAQAWGDFRSEALSNNHLLSDDNEIGKQIMKVERGDQIFMRGYLAEYSHSNNSFKRGTSITRADSGAYACETVFVVDSMPITGAKKVFIVEVMMTCIYSLQSYSLLE